MRHAHRGGVILDRSASLVLEADRLSVDRTVHGGVNRIQNGFAVVDDVVVPETENLEALAFQPLGPRLIPGCSASQRVVRSVDLDDEARCQAGKISNVRPYRHLTAKVGAGHRQLAKHLPQANLCAGFAGAKPARGEASRFVYGPQRSHRSPHPARFASDPPPPGEGKRTCREPAHSGRPSALLGRRAIERAFPLTASCGCRRRAAFFPSACTCRTGPFSTRGRPIPSG